MKGAYLPDLFKATLLPDLKTFQTPTVQFTGLSSLTPHRGPHILLDWTWSGPLFQNPSIRFFFPVNFLHQGKRLFFTVSSFETSYNLKNWFAWLSQATLSCKRWKLHPRFGGVFIDRINRNPFSFSLNERFYRRWAGFFFNIEN